MAQNLDGESPFRMGEDFADEARLARVACLGFVFAVATFGNFAVPLLLWNSHNGEVISAGLGLLAAEVSLLAALAVLGPLRLVVRLPLALLALAFLTASYVAGLRIADDGGLPLEVPLLVVGLALGGFVATAVPFAVMRFFQRQCIAAHAIERTPTEGAQFSLRHLLIATAAVAVLVTLSKAALSGLGLRGGAPWFQVIGGCFVFLVFSVSIAVLCLFSVLVDERRELWILALAALLLAGPLVAIVGANFFFGRGANTWEPVRMAYTYAFSLAAGNLGVWCMLRLLGSRLVPVLGN